MLNDTAPVVDDRRRGMVHGYWLTMSALAAQRGVSKQAISKNLKRWADLGTPVSTRGEGRKVMVNVAEYDARKGEIGDLGRELGEQTKKIADVGSDPVYAREQARAKAYEADLKLIERDKQLGRLIEVESLRCATTACGEGLVRVIEQIVTRAEEVAAAVSKDGVLGARGALKTIARDLRAQAAKEFAKLLAGAMAGEPDIAPKDNE
jgi:hypothetical protein